MADHEPEHEHEHDHPTSRSGPEPIHHHHHEHVDLALNVRVRRVLDGVAILFAALTVVGMVVVNHNREPVQRSFDLASDVFDARVTRVTLAPCAGTVEGGPECRIVEFELLAGPDRGETRTQEFTLGSVTTPRLHSGDRVVLNHFAGEEVGFDYQFADRQRRPTLLVLAAAFAAIVVVVGRMRGLAALAGLVASLVVILQFGLPALLGGASPVVVAVLTASAIAYLALYLAHGFNPLTTVALLGTLASLALTVVLSAVFTAAANFSGFATEEATLLVTLNGRIDLVGLLLGGAVIGALGALDDMTVTQTSAVAELHSANPGLSATELYRRALRIGRDHVSSTVNTLALAYVGASLPTFLIFAISEQSLGAIANSEVVAVEIVRTLVGSIGLVAAVPVTTALAAFIVRAGIHETGRHAPTTTHAH